MRNALTFHAAIICVVSLLILALKGKQNRRERDEMEATRVGTDQFAMGVSTPQVKESVKA